MTTIADFLRLYPLRAQTLMWFLGAGASAAAGVPTAGQMIWEFKRSLYCSQQGKSLASCSDLDSQIVQARLQKYFDDLGSYPGTGAADEYARYFEAAYPSDQDRRRYLDMQIKGGTPSYGHKALVELMRADQARLIWTVNFDKCIEDAAASAYGGTGHLIVGTLDSAGIAQQALIESRWPLLVKLHGDFHSIRLKNTRDELRTQDAQMRRNLVDACQRFGLIVVGYSGRDASIMEAIGQALDAGKAFPSGLFWFCRSADAVLPDVRSVIQRAREAGVEAELIEIETFDELLADVVRLHGKLPQEVISRLDQSSPRLTPAQVPPRQRGSWPILRLNALPILEWPTTCRLVRVAIGGTSEVREHVRAAQADLIVGRRQAGVLAFGSDGEVTKAFQDRKIEGRDLYTIEPRRLRYESAELGLLYEALCKAISRTRPVRVERRRHTYSLVAESSRDKTQCLKPLKAATQTLEGTIGDTGLHWAEALELRLEWRFDQLWLLMLPTVWVEFDVEKITPQTREARKEFIPERLARRYNRQVHTILKAWEDLLTGGSAPQEFRAFGIADGVDAVFKVGEHPAFSWRVQT